MNSLDCTVFQVAFYDENGDPIDNSNNDVKLEIGGAVIEEGNTHINVENVSDGTFAHELEITPLFGYIAPDVSDFRFAPNLGRYWYDTDGNEVEAPTGISIEGNTLNITLTRITNIKAKFVNQYGETVNEGIECYVYYDENYADEDPGLDVTDSELSVGTSYKLSVGLLESYLQFKEYGEVSNFETQFTLSSTDDGSVEFTPDSTASFMDFQYDAENNTVVLTVSVVNTNLADAKFTAVDAEDSTALTGATIKIIDDDSNHAVAEWESDGSEHLVEALATDKFYRIEITPPAKSSLDAEKFSYVPEGSEVYSGNCAIESFSFNEDGDIIAYYSEDKDEDGAWDEANVGDTLAIPFERCVYESLELYDKELTYGDGISDGLVDYETYKINGVAGTLNTKPDGSSALSGAPFVFTLTNKSNSEETYSFGTGGKCTAPPGKYELSAYITGSSSYTFVASTVTVNPKELSASNFEVTAKDKEYTDGNTDVELQVTPKNLINDDTLEVVITGSFTDGNIGDNKEVTYTISGITGSAADNYILPAGGITGTTTADIIDSHVHDYTQETVKDDAIKTPATCKELAVYYKSCECGEVGNNDTETFRGGTLAGHQGGTATCTEKAVCSECGEEYGEVLGHEWPERWTEHDNRLHKKVCENDNSHVMYEEHEAAVTCGTTGGECKCGRAADKAHDFDKANWVSDEDTHWHGCKNCIAREDEAEHNYPNKTVGKDVPQTCEDCKYGGYITTLKDSEFDDHHITPALKKLGYESAEAIEAEMHKEVEGVTSWGGKKEDTKLYEVELMYSEDGGLSWLPASEEHFPKGADGKPGKLAVTLSVDKDIDTHDYMVVHMFSKDAFGKIAGKTETPDVSEFKKGDKSYITFYVTGLSPIMVAWEEATTTDASTPSGGTGNTSSEDSIEPENPVMPTGYTDPDGDGVYEDKDGKRYIPDQDGDGKPEPDSDGDGMFEGTKDGRKYAPDDDGNIKKVREADLKTYEVVDGELVWIIGSTEDLTFTIDAPAEKFRKLFIGGEKVSKGDYSYISGSTIITIDADYLNSLNTGKYDVKAVYTDGNAATTLKVKAAAAAGAAGASGEGTATGDDSNLLLWIMIATAAAAGGVGTLIPRRRRSH